MSIAPGTVSYRTEAKVNVAETLEAHGVQVRRLAGKPDEIYLCCPFCTENQESEDTRFRFGINIVNGWAHCFNCGWRTRDKSYLEQELDRAFQTGMFELGEAPPQREIKIALPEDFAVVPIKRGERDYWETKAYKFLKKRNVTDTQIIRHRIGYSMRKPLAGRIIIPIYVGGKLTGVVGRDFTGKDDPPYKNSLGNKSVFNLPRKKNHIGVLMEGVFDALAVERVSRGEWDSMALLGHALTPTQLEQLRGYKRLILWPDPPTEDNPNDPGIVKFLQMIPELKRITRDLAFVSPYMDGRANRDPDEHGIGERRQKVLEATPYSQTLEQRLRAWLAFRKEEQ